MIDVNAGTNDDVRRERLTLRVDERGRVEVPKRVRERLGIEPNERVEAVLTRSRLRIGPQPSSQLDTATAGRDDWKDVTPEDAGKMLFGPLEEVE